MLGQSLHEKSSVKAFAQHIVEQYHHLAHLILYREVHDAEIVLRVEHVQVFQHLLIGDISLTERSGLIEDGEGVAHSAISLLGNDCQRLFLVFDAFLLGHLLQVFNGVLHRHALKVINLTTRQDGGQNLMFLCGSQDKDDVCRRFLQRLEESVEGCCREHVHLVNDKHLVFAYLRWYAGLLHQCLDMLHRVIRCSIELKDVQRALLVKRLTRLALVTCLTLCRRILAVDGFGKDTCTSGLSHASRTTEQIGVSQFSALHRILQRGSQRLLSHHRVERHRAVLSCRNNIFFHILLLLECKDKKKK